MLAAKETGISTICGASASFKNVFGMLHSFKTQIFTILAFKCSLGSDIW